MGRKATGQVVTSRTKSGKVFAVRFPAYGERRYVTLGTAREGWNAGKARAELETILAAVKLGVWKPPPPEPEKVEPPTPDQTFHEFASKWFERIEPALNGRTPEDYRNRLTRHLLPFFARHRLPQITIAEVDRYVTVKVREGRLCNNGINRTVALLAQVLEDAVEYGHLASNPARGRKRRLKASKVRHASLGADQVAALFRATANSTHRAILATAIMAGGLRVSELTGLRRRDLNLAQSRLTVCGTKTDAADRVVELPPELRDELAEYLVSVELRPTAYLFPGRGGKRRDRHAVRNRVLYPAIERANELLAERELPAISPDVTFHSLRRTYASLAAEAGIDPAWTAAQIGHERAGFTLDVYTDVRNRRSAPAERIGGLIRAGEDEIKAVKAVTPSNSGPGASNGDGDEAPQTRTTAVNSNFSGA